MSAIKEARQKAFKRWVEYDIRANQCEKAVNKLEYLNNGAFCGIKARTDMYNGDGSDIIVRTWSDWRCEYIDEIITYARKLGFNNEHYPTKNGIDFDDTKYGLDIFYDHWIKQAINDYGFPINTQNSSGTFHRFMLFEEQVVKFGLVDKLDENGYADLEKLIQKCIDYLVNVVEEKIVQYHKLLKYVEDKRENALQSCEDYIYARLEEN